MADLSAANAARLSAALAKLYRFSDGVRSLGDEIERRRAAGPLEKYVGDGTIDYSRSRFNRMDAREQAAYMARLKAKRLYWLSGLLVPKIVFDHVEG